jgi:translation initiation factor 3 subunit M
LGRWLILTAIRENLLKARISQPTASIRVVSVSSAASRSFGAQDWQLLESRLQDWKQALTNVQTILRDAESIAAQGPITNRPGNAHRSEKGPRREQKSERGDARQERQEVETAA